jgi:hypothetical protein
MGTKWALITYYKLTVVFILTVRITLIMIIFRRTVINVEEHGMGSKWTSQMEYTWNCRMDCSICEH